MSISPDHVGSVGVVRPAARFEERGLAVKIVVGDNRGDRRLVEDHRGGMGIEEIEESVIGQIGGDGGGPAFEVADPHDDT